MLFRLLTGLTGKLFCPHFTILTPSLSHTHVHIHLQAGAPALYTYLTVDQLDRFGNYNSHRCAAAAHTYCLCAEENKSPPPPPHLDDKTVFQYSGTGLPVDSSGHATAFYKKVATDAAMPADFREHVTNYECIAEDTGAGHCARHCATELGDKLFAFSVTGLRAPPPPPNDPVPLAPPTQPPNPLPPWNFAFANSDACAVGGIFTGNECRDGGVGSVYPP